MNAKPIVSVRDVSKKYSYSLRSGMFQGMADIACSFFGVSQKREILRKNEFWALKNLSFELHRGESLAIVGSNGSGKSTLLKLLNGIFFPDTGSISIHGKTAALIEIGAGFHPLLTGRENIWVNGQILGMTRAEIARKMDGIIAFAELEKFIDTQVKFYSTGMHARLGFSVAIHSDPDLFLVDEVLAVGDLAFALKCSKKIAEYRNRGGTLILVSHGMHNVKHHCQRALWIEKGVFQSDGPSMHVASDYERFMSRRGADGGEAVCLDPSISITHVQFPESLRNSEPLRVKINFDFKREVCSPVVGLHLFSKKEDALVFSHYTHLEGCRLPDIQGKWALNISTPSLFLNKGEYLLSIQLSEREMANQLLWHQKMYPVTVSADRECYGLLDARPLFSWESLT